VKRITFVLLVLIFLCSCSNQFNKDIWLEEPDKRNDMVYNFVNNYDIKGMTKEEITSLLGEPEQKVDAPAIQYVYYLGRAGFGVDDSLLRLYFDQKETIESYKITHD